MSGFLEQTAIYLHRAYGDDLHRFCIVFPNVRAGLFFKKYLAALSEKPVWAPAFRSLDSLMEEITGLTKADHLSLIFDLFKAYREHQPTNESFEEFYFWGEMLLNDFDDTDKHLVDARDLFRNVSDLKELDGLFDYLTDEQKNAIRLFWQNFNGGAVGSFKNDFAAVWPSLYRIYESFKKRLREKSFGYEGMIQRDAVERLRAGDVDHVPFEKYVFIGFNALTACETRFFKSLQKQNRAVFFWDYDDYYVNNRRHEAGAFMRDNIRNFPPELHIDSRNLVEKDKHIEIISVPSDTGQAGMAGKLLEQNSENIDWSRTAVVLPDEHLLLPLLSSLPEAAKDINITMGYPFTCSPVNSLFERLASLQQHIRVYADGARFYHNDVCAILHHPYIQNIAPEEVDQTVKFIVEHNRIYVPSSEIPDSRLFRLVFTQCTRAREFVDYLTAIVSEIAATKTGQSDTEGNDPPDPSPEEQYKAEYLFVFYTALQRVRDVLSTEEIDLDVRIFCRLLRKIMASLKIPFSGEPLKGLQVMGMLETRALDFDRVIILSMNEGIFPRASSQQSFIPYNLRKGFGLTTSEQNDAVGAYLFYRLVQRAKDVHLIYNSAVTDRNTGEMSRFLTQMVYEPAFDIQRRDITFGVGIDKDREIVKERTDEVRRKLDTYLSNEGDIGKLSPSALNNYLDCPLRFYFRYVDGLKESDQVTDEIDQSVFGKLLHKTMELLYLPYIGKEIDAETIETVRKDDRRIRGALLKAFAESYFRSERVTESDITGRNIIIREVLLKYLKQILEVDKADAPFTILTLENSLDVRVPVNNNTRTEMLNMTGYIDRLDNVRGALRIIDYKTGNARRNFTDIPDLFDPEKAGNHAAMQTLVYAYMTHIAYPQYPKIGLGLYVMKDLFRENYDPRIYMSRKPPVENYFDVSETFEPELNALLSEIFLSDAPFTQTRDIKKCLTCLYADICRRKHK